MKLSLLGVGGCGGGYHTLWAITGFRLRLKYRNSLPLLWTCTLSPSYLISAKIPFGHFLKAYSTDLHASACSATSKCNARHYKIKYNAMQHKTQQCRRAPQDTLCDNTLSNFLLMLLTSAHRLDHYCHMFKCIHNPPKLFATCSVVNCSLPAVTQTTQNCCNTNCSPLQQHKLFTACSNTNCSPPAQTQTVHHCGNIN